MRKLLYIVMIFIGVSACTSRQESKPYDWDDDLHQRLLADFPGERLYPQIHSRRDGRTDAPMGREQGA